jgi:hypothetical protein
MFDWKSLTIAIVAAGAGYWMLQPAASDRINGGAGGVEAQVAQIAARMHGVTPTAMSDGSTLRSVQAAGRTITLTMDGQADWTAITDDEAVTATRAAELCGQADIRALIAAGARIVIESRTAKGAPLPTLLVDRCPAG